MVILCHAHEYVYFEEYLRSLQMGPVMLYTEKTPPYRIARHYICIRRIPYRLIPPGSKISFINTEQLSVPYRFEEFKQYAKGVHVYDYSRENIKISGVGEYLPYKEYPPETEFLKQCLSQPKEYDFAVVGNLSEYRKKVIEDVRKKGYTVNIVSGWREVRDKEIGKCKALLNIHFDPQFTVYESIRCERWRYAGMPIYSEPCSDEMPSDVKLISDIVEK